MNEVKEQERQGKMPFVHKTYRVWITESIGGYVHVDASNREEADEIVMEVLDHWGVDSMLYEDDGECREQMKKNKIRSGKHTYGERETTGVEEIDD